MSSKREVPFFNYPALYAGKRDQYLTALDDALGRGAYIMQKDLRRFEKNLASYLGVRHVLGTADGTMALLMGLLAIGIEPGDEVIVPTHTFVASASAVHHAGGVPVLVDCGEDHLMDVAAVRSAVSSRTKAIMPVQLNGRMVDMDALREVADEYGLHIIEDACQALGASYKGKKAGTFGVVSAFSFYPSKTLGGFGDGGAVVTNDDDLANKLALLRDHGREGNECRVWGFNARLDNIQAVILDLKLAEYDEAIARRRGLATIYDKGLRNISQLKLPPPAESNGDHFDIFQNYEIEAECRDELITYLKENGVGVIIQWGGALIHQYKELEDCRVAGVEYAEGMSRKFMLLPMNTSLTDADVEYVCEHIRCFYNEGTGEMSA